jgi:hypothetical protein
MFTVVFYFIVPAIALLALGRWFWKKWNQSAVDQRLENLKEKDEMYDKIKDVDTSEVKRKNHAIDDFMEETQDK